MTVRELIAELAKLEPESEVILSHDAEGNGYSPLSSMKTSRYHPETTWRGEVNGRRKGGVTAVVLYPVC